MPHHAHLVEVTSLPPKRHGSMLSVCSVPGCTTLTMGGTCVEHDVPAGVVVFPRGRPYAPDGEKELTLTTAE